MEDEQTKPDVPVMEDASSVLPLQVPRCLSTSGSRLWRHLPRELQWPQQTGHWELRRSLVIAVLESIHLLSRFAMAVLNREITRDCKVHVALADCRIGNRYGNGDTFRISRQLRHADA